MEPHLSRAELKRGPLDVEAFCAPLAGKHDGALVRFEGRVRAENAGQATLFLEYDAYESLARQQMAELIEACRRRWPVHGAGIAHRLGRVEIGETAVVVAVAAAHRAEALAACGWLMDAVKQNVAIWKKEYSPAGGHWLGHGPEAAACGAQR